MFLNIRRLGERLYSDESGQDLLEYALLTAAIGLAGATAWVSLEPMLLETYERWFERSNSLHTPPPPSGAGGS